MKYVLGLFLLAVGCVTSPPPPPPAAGADAARGPWSEVPAVEMPTGDTSIPIALLRDVADALLKRPGAKVCDPSTQRPIVGLSTEYCSTVYVAGNRGSLSWRVTEPVTGNHGSCEPFDVVVDGDYPASQVWVVGFVHNHPCGTPPSSKDLSAWPTNAFNPYVAMAEFRPIAGNRTASGEPNPAVHEDTAIEMASAVVAELKDGTRVILRYFPTGEIQQWSNVKADWVTLGTCSPRGVSRSQTPRCRPEESLHLLRE